MIQPLTDTSTAEHLDRCSGVQGHYGAQFENPRLYRRGVGLTSRGGRTEAIPAPVRVFLRSMMNVYAIAKIKNVKKKNVFEVEKPESDYVMWTKKKRKNWKSISGVRRKPLLVSGIFDFQRAPATAVTRIKGARREWRSGSAILLVRGSYRGFFFLQKPRH